uniref:Putative tick transposon n=1 Tax=Ixodes ricinus TaxID=34613 RepID=A0A6B0UCH3_IXORI
MYCHRSIFLKNAILLIYNSLFLSHILYCPLVWGNTTMANLNKILMLPKKMLRIICNVSYDYPSKTLFAKLDLMHIYNI